MDTLTPQGPIWGHTKIHYLL